MFQTVKFFLRILFVGLVFIMAVFLSSGDSLAMNKEPENDIYRLDFSVNS